MLNKPHWPKNLWIVECISLSPQALEIKPETLLVNNSTGLWCSLECFSLSSCCHAIDIQYFFTDTKVQFVQGSVMILVRFFAFVVLSLQKNKSYNLSASVSFLHCKNRLCWTEHGCVEQNMVVLTAFWHMLFRILTQCVIKKKAFGQTDTINVLSHGRAVCVYGKKTIHIFHMVAHKKLSNEYKSLIK